MFDLNSTGSNDSQVGSQAAEQACWVILTCVSLYLLVVLVIFEIKHAKRKWKGVNKKQKSQKLWVYIFSENPMCIIAAAFSLLRCATLQVELSLGAHSDGACTAFHYMNTAFNNLNILAVYVMLWTRQRTLYNNIALKYLLTPYLRVFNIAVIVALVVAMAAVTSLVYVGLQLVSSPIGCVYVKSSDVIQWAIVGASFVSTVALQVCLLGLVLYPLTRHYGLGRGGRVARGGKIQSVVVRLTISTAVCVISDLFLGLGISIYDSMMHDRALITWMVYNLNMIINTVALVCSFKDWPLRLLPCKSKAKAGRMSGADTARSTSYDKTELPSRVTLTTGKL